MKAVVTSSFPSVSAASLSAALTATRLSTLAISKESPEDMILWRKSLSLFLSWSFLMKLNGILYCWSRNTVFLVVVLLAEVRWTGYSRASRVVSLTIEMSVVPPFSSRTILLWI